ALSGPRTEDICYATSNRQQAVQAVAAESDLVLVLGSQNSSNSRRLAEVAESQGVPAHLVDDAESVELSWLAGGSRVGVTAAASTSSRRTSNSRCLRKCLNCLCRSGSPSGWEVTCSSRR